MIDCSVSRPIPVNEALLACAANDDEKNVKKLLGMKADPNARNTNSANASYYAAKNGNTEMMKSLLDAGADIHAAPNGFSASIMHAIFENRVTNLDIIKVLTESKFEVNKTFQDQEETVFEAACISGSQEQIKHLIEYKADLKTSPQAIFRAIFRPEILELLIEHRADVHSRYDFGHLEGDPRPLHRAAVANELSTTLLLQAKADPLATDGKGLTPLQEVQNSIRSYEKNPKLFPQEHLKLLTATSQVLSQASAKKKTLDSIIQ